MWDRGRTGSARPRSPSQAAGAGQTAPSDPGTCPKPRHRLFDEHRSRRNVAEERSETFLRVSFCSFQASRARGDSWQGAPVRRVRGWQSGFSKLRPILRRLAERAGPCSPPSRSRSAGLIRLLQVIARFSQLRGPFTTTGASVMTSVASEGLPNMLGTPRGNLTKTRPSTDLKASAPRDPLRQAVLNSRIHAATGFAAPSRDTHGSRRNVAVTPSSGGTCTITFCQFAWRFMPRGSRQAVPIEDLTNSTVTTTQKYLAELPTVPVLTQRKSSESVRLHTGHLARGLFGARAARQNRGAAVGRTGHG